MKTIQKILSMVYVIAIVCFSCRKEDQPNLVKPKDIAGTWDWKYTWKDLPMSDSNPLNPQNTGIQEILVFKSDNTWSRTQNNIKVDSGSYTLGHGDYLPYVGAYHFIYDSIVYYKIGTRIEFGWDYYSISNDTLFNCPCLGGRFGSYSFPYNGSSTWVKR